MSNAPSLPMESSILESLDFGEKLDKILMQITKHVKKCEELNHTSLPFEGQRMIYHLRII